MGMATAIDVSKLKPNAWQNRKKTTVSSSQTLNAQTDNHPKPKIYSRRKRTPNNIMSKMQQEEESAFDTETTDNDKEEDEEPCAAQIELTKQRKLYAQQQKALNDSKSYNKRLEKEHDEQIKALEEYKTAMIAKQNEFKQQTQILNELKTTME